MCWYKQLKFRCQHRVRQQPERYVYCRPYATGEVGVCRLQDDPEPITDDEDCKKCIDKVSNTASLGFTSGQVWYVNSVLTLAVGIEERETNAGTEILMETTEGDM